MSDKFQIEINEAGCDLLRGEFTDYDGESCSIQESSLADQDGLWLGCNHNTKPHHVTGDELAPRMHLTKPMAQALIPLLMRFARFGTLAEGDSKAEFGANLIQWSDAATALEHADAKKLLWLLLSQVSEDRIAFSPFDAVLNALENLLYPEYDGETVKMTDQGWSTPDGEINYL